MGVLESFLAEIVAVLVGCSWMALDDAVFNGEISGLGICVYPIFNLLFIKTGC